MHSIVYTHLKRGLLALALAMLAACSSTPMHKGEVAPYYVASVPIDSSSSKAKIEAEHGAKVISFKPEAGFAILGFSKAEGELSSLDTNLNQNTFASPEVEAAGLSAWSGGWSAWSGGWSAWSGGWSAWSGGSSVPQAPAENQAFWNKIQLTRAHAISRKFGEGVTVAVIDTGIDLNHPMFQGRLTASSTWKDYVDGDSYPMDVSGGSGYGHGTGVAGLILQVAPKAKIMPIRVLDSTGKGDLDKVISAIDWAVSKGARIINLSLGSNEYSHALQLMTNYAGSQGVYIVASAGNNGTQNAATFPARMTYWGNNRLFAVGSVRVNNDLLSNFSAFGDGLFASAPGEDIYSAYPGNKTAKYTGTSFAAPLVAGALALARAEAPAATDLGQFSNYMINSVYRNGFDEANMAARNIQDYAFGYGILDVEALIRNLPGWTSPLSSPELVANSGFENGSMAGWWANSSSNVSVQSSGAFAGSKVARIGGNETGMTYTVSNLSPNTTYTLSAIMRNTVAGAGFSMGILNFGGSGIWKWSDRTSYAPTTITFTTGPNSTSAQISIWRGGPGYTFVDNVSVKRW